MCEQGVEGVCGQGVVLLFCRVCGRRRAPPAGRLGDARIAHPAHHLLLRASLRRARGCLGSCPPASHTLYLHSHPSQQAGISTADRVMTVSPGYSEEITTYLGGWGMEALLGGRGPVLNGIVNGIDMDEWNPATDPMIPANYDMRSLKTGKAACKAALQKVRGRKGASSMHLRGGPSQNLGAHFGLACALVSEATRDCKPSRESNPTTRCESKPSMYYAHHRKSTPPLITGAGSAREARCADGGVHWPAGLPEGRRHPAAGASLRH